MGDMTRVKICGTASRNFWEIQQKGQVSKPSAITIEELVAIGSRNGLTRAIRYFEVSSDPMRTSCLQA
jgi:hypothetical protein